MIHEDNPVFKNNIIDVGREIEWNKTLNNVKWTASLIVSPFMLAIGIMIGANLETIIGWIR